MKKTILLSALLSFVFTCIHAQFTQTDGKTITLGSNSIVRHNIDGSIDNTFGVSGTRLLDFTPAYVAFQADGKIVVTGSHNIGTDNFFFYFHDHCFPLHPMVGHKPRIRYHNTTDDGIYNTVFCSARKRIVSTFQLPWHYIVFHFC